MGVHSVAYAFPRVRIITTAVDKKVNDEFHIIPGIGKSSLIDCQKQRKKWKIQYLVIQNNCFAGNFGDRYFGTDATSDWYESDDGMDYWISSRRVCEQLCLHASEKGTFKHLISYDCGPSALRYLSLSLTGSCYRFLQYSVLHMCPCSIQVEASTDPQTWEITAH